MEDELLKRNTDCVYFLASPFTCKKGVECEYRHSEMARLNPRDCWYWLSANCLNPACAFRHPPLDLHNEASTEAAPPSVNRSSAPIKKTTVPCYYYYSGYCSKGDQCLYLHEAVDTLGLKSKMSNSGAAAPVLPLDSKTSGRADSGPIVAEKHSTLSEMAIKAGNGLQCEQKQLFQRPATSIFHGPNNSEQLTNPQCKETFAGKIGSLLTTDVSIKSESVVSLDSDQSSEELIDGNIMRDECLESSPGFDVLVDGKTEDIAYEDDPEYLHALDGNDGDCERLYFPRGLAHEAEYDERKLFDDGLYESSEYLEDELRNNFPDYSLRRTRDRKARHVLESKRKFYCEESLDSGSHDVDLRDYLSKRRMVDSYLETRNVRYDWVHQLRDDRQERLQRHASDRQIHGRVGSKVERNSARLPRGKVSVVDTEHRGRPCNTQHNDFRRYNGLKSQQSSTERRSYSKRERYAQESAFYGPKSLAEIKGNGKTSDFKKIKSVDFEGPKPLSEILKDKKKTVSASDAILSSGN